MKIIAKTGGGYLIETTENEIAQLHGFEGRHDSAYRSTIYELEIGHEIELSKIVQAAKYVRTLDSAVLEQSHERLLTMAERLNDIRDLVHKLNLFEDLKKEVDHA